MRSLGLLMTAVLALAAAASGATAGSTDPIEIAQMPYAEIFSPTFFWDDKADFVRVGSATCPKGRAVTGGLNIVQGHASLRVLESYPDGESWVVRVVNRQKPAKVESLQVRGFALCLLSSARKSSVMLSQRTRLLHVSTRFGLSGGYVSGSGRQTCPKGSLVVSGGFGLDPAFHGPNNLRMELSYPDPDGWNVRAVNGTEGTGAADVRTYAVCLGNSEGVDIRNYKNVYFAEADALVKAENGTARQTVSCGEGAYVLSGGSRTIRGRSAMVETQESFPDTPSSWTITVTNRGDRKSGEAAVKFYAVCIKK